MKSDMTDWLLLKVLTTKSSANMWPNAIKSIIVIHDRDHSLTQTTLNAVLIDITLIMSIIGFGFMLLKEQAFISLYKMW